MNASDPGERGFFLRRLNPASRILSAFFLSIAVALSWNTASLLISLCLACVLVILFRPGLRRLLVKLSAVNFFILFLFVFIPFSVAGRVLFAMGPLKFTLEGLEMAIFIALKSNVIVIILLCLVASLPPLSAGRGLQKLFVPVKLVQLFYFVILYLDVIDTERKRLLTAARARGFVPRTNLHTYRTLAYFVGMLLVGSVERSERVHQAMLCRGFKGEFYTLDGFRNTVWDVLFPFAAFIFAVFVSTNEIYSFWTFDV